jgi:hypothetical protein
MMAASVTSAQQRGSPRDLACRKELTGRSCRSTDAVLLAYEEADVERQACVYVVNAFDEKLEHAVDVSSSECEFVRDAPRTTRFMSAEVSEAETGRLSKDGVVVVRAFDRDTRGPVDLDKLGKLTLRVTAGDRTKTGSVVGGVIQVHTTNLSSAGIGDVVAIDLVKEEAVVATRRGFHRPRTAWYVDYQLATTGFVAGVNDDNEFRATALPAAVELQHRNYSVLESQVFDFALGVAPYLSSNDSWKMTGFVTYGRMGFGGAQLGAGLYFGPIDEADSDDKAKPDLFILVSFSDAILQKLKGPDGGIVKID